ncbi:MAG TPA: hypothetical protein VIJ21_01145 [Solirubrobacterales bacterium]
MDDPPNDVRLTDIQLGILAALCRPLAGGNRFAIPATNQQIADEAFLSVDAVKGHLRTLYRKFGIEDLAHNQKRARLAELAIEGGYLPKPEPASVPLGAASVLTERREGERPKKPTKSGRSIGPYVTMVILILVVIGATLSISGIFNQGSTSVQVPTPAAYRAEVAGYCELALAGAPEPSGKGRPELARGYLEVIETMRGRLESLVQPAVPDIALERFSVGLTNAANYTSDVAEGPASPGSAAEAKDVAELTFAAGQVLAGAAGYGLGHECLAIGDLVADSAQNAAAP